MSMGDGRPHHNINSADTGKHWSCLNEAQAFTEHDFASQLNCSQVKKKNNMLIVFASIINILKTKSVRWG